MRKLKSRSLYKGLIALSLVLSGSVVASIVEQRAEHTQRDPAALRRSETIPTGCGANCAPPGYLEPVTQLSAAPPSQVPAAPSVPYSAQSHQYSTPRAAAANFQMDETAMNSFPHQGLTRLPRACNAFITRNGELGPYGKIVAREISRYDIYFSANNHAEQICRNFQSFRTKEEKIQFWVWVYASLAAQESGCDPNKPAPPDLNPNGIAVGLFQMEKRADLRAGRDVAYHGNYCSGNPFSPAVNIRCSARIMAGGLSRHQGLIFRSKYNYWGPLQSRRNNITQNSIAQYQACNK